MANEINYTMTLTYTNAAYNIQAVTLTSGADMISINGTQPGPYERNVFQVTSSIADIPATLIGTLGVALVHNCDSNNPIDIYANTSDSSNPLLTIGPGEWQLLRFATSSTPAVKTPTGTALLEYFLIGN